MTNDIPVLQVLDDDNWMTVSQPRTLSSVVCSTRGVTSTLAHGSICIALFVATCIGWRSPSVALAAVASPATTGHASEFLDTLGMIRVCVDVLYTFDDSLGRSVGAVYPVRKDDRNCRAAAGDRVANAFSIAGPRRCRARDPDRSYEHIPDPWTPALDLNSSYRFKILVAVVMTCLAVVNRYMVVPMHRERHIVSSRPLVFGARVEIALGALAFMLVASFGLQDPV